MSDLSTIWVYFKGQILPFLINAGLKKGKISLFLPQKLFWKMSKHLRIIHGYRWTIILGHLFILQFSQNFLWLSLSQFENMSFYKSPNIYSLITVHHPKLDFITKTQSFPMPNIMLARKWMKIFTLSEHSTLLQHLSFHPVRINLLFN